MAPLTVGLSDYWTIAMFNILYQDFYIFPMCNKTTWTIGLLLNEYLLEYMAPLTVGLSDYWTIGLLFYLMFSIN